MGIRINSAVIIGVKFTPQETKAYEAFMEGKSRYWFLMRLIEQELKIDWEKKQKIYSVEDHYYSIYFTHYFSKKSLKSNRSLQPYRPFWTGMSKKELEKVERNLYTFTAEYLRKMGWESEARSFDKGSMIQWPCSKPEGEPAHLLGVVEESNYDRYVDWALADLFQLEGQDRTIALKGQRPWEAGTSFQRKSKAWHTFNGQNMLPEAFLPKDKKSILSSILHQHGGTRQEFIDRKKGIWDKYHRWLRPYKIYNGDGWNGSSFHFYPADRLFELISKHIPAIKYDVMRLEKFLCLYWG